VVVRRETRNLVDNSAISIASAISPEPVLCRLANDPDFAAATP
jgi:hypothetical protein